MKTGQSADARQSEFSNDRFWYTDDVIRIKVSPTTIRHLGRDATKRTLRRKNQN